MRLFYDKCSYYLHYYLLRTFSESPGDVAVNEWGTYMIYTLVEHLAGNETLIFFLNKNLSVTFILSHYYILEHNIKC
jgi:hypothetical protein